MTSSTLRIGITALAAEFNIDRVVARRYLSEAGIPRAPDKSYPAPAARAAIRARKDPHRTLGNRLAGRAGGKLHAIDLDNDEPEVDPLDCTPSTPKATTPEFDALRAVKSELASEQVRKIRIANDAAERRLIDRAAVTETLAHVVANARTVLLTIGTRLAPTLAGETDPEAIAAAIDDEIRRALTELATTAETGGAHA